MAARRLRILLLSSWFPYPPTNGSKVRLYQLLQQLAAGHDVVLVGLLDSPADTPQAAAVRDLCEAIEVWPRPYFDPHRWRARLAFLHPWPRSLIDTHCAALAECVDRRLKQEHFDLIVACQLDAARYVPGDRRVPALLEEVELTTLYEQAQKAPSLAARARYALTWWKQRRFVRQLLRRFDACSVVSDEERDLLVATVGKLPPVSVIPNGVQVPDQLPTAPRHAQRLMFTGTLRYAANHDAVVWFIEAVLPILREAVPQVEMQITGDDGGLPLPADPAVTRLGVVPDVRAALATAAVAIVPLRVGGGTRFKILDAFATGTAVVSTRKGAEGLAVRDGEHLLLADTAPEFAAAVLRLLHDASLAARLAAKARELVQAEYDWRAIGPRFEALVQAVAARSVVPSTAGEG